MKRIYLNILVVAVILVGLLLPFVAFPTPVYADSWLTGFDYRVKITFDNSDSAVNLNWFPVLVHLDDSNADWTKIQDDGDDIRFTDSNGQTLLSAELLEWDDTNDAWMYCNVTRIDAGSTTDYIYMYYGNTTVSNYWDAEAVWRSEYVAVWHFEEASGTVYDSTDNNNDSDSESGVTYGADGVVGDCLSYDGNDYLDIGDQASLEFTDEFTW